MNTVGKTHLVSTSDNIDTDEDENVPLTLRVYRTNLSEYFYMREVYLVGNEKYIQGNAEIPDLDSCEYNGFREGFMKSVLLSLLTQGKLTQIQYERCIEKVMRKCADTPIT